jgi:hypothetical protein
MGRKMRIAPPTEPKAPSRLPTAPSVATFQETVDWFDRYIAALKQLLSRRVEESSRVRNLKRDPDRTLSSLVRELLLLKSVWSQRAVMEDEVISEMPTEPSRQPAISGSTVPMTFVRIGRQPPHLADVVEVDYFDDEVIAPMPAPPSRTVIMRFEWVGPQRPRISDQLPE